MPDLNLAVLRQDMTIWGEPFTVLVLLLKPPVPHCHLLMETPEECAGCGSGHYYMIFEAARENGFTMTPRNPWLKKKYQGLAGCFVAYHNSAMILNSDTLQLKSAGLEGVKSIQGCRTGYATTFLTKTQL